MLASLCLDFGQLHSDTFIGVLALFLVVVTVRVNGVACASPRQHRSLSWAGFD